MGGREGGQSAELALGSPPAPPGGGTQARREKGCKECTGPGPRLPGLRGCPPRPRRSLRLSWWRGRHLSLGLQPGLPARVQGLTPGASGCPEARPGGGGGEPGRRERAAGERASYGHPRTPQGAGLGGRGVPLRPRFDFPSFRHSSSHAHFLFRLSCHCSRRRARGSRCPGRALQRPEPCVPIPSGRSAGRAEARAGGETPHPAGSGVRGATVPRKVSPQRFSDSDGPGPRGGGGRTCLRPTCARRARSFVFPSRPSSPPSSLRSE